MKKFVLTEIQEICFKKWLSKVFLTISYKASNTQDEYEYLTSQCIALCD